MRWTQAGYRKIRFEGDKASISKTYSEVLGDTYTIHYFAPPTEGTTHEYKLHKSPDNTNDGWFFYFDGVLFDIIWDTFWLYGACNEVYYGGETLNIEDHMPGSLADKTEFRECWFETLDNGAQYPYFDATTQRNDDPSSFGWALIGTGLQAFDIWDKRT